VDGWDWTKSQRSSRCDLVQSRKLRMAYSWTAYSWTKSSKPCSIVCQAMLDSLAFAWSSCVVWVKFYI
jgi:hypothetical protein